MSLEQPTELYASVLRQLLPEGVYDTAEMTHVADDIYAHAKALAQADIDSHRLLQVLETIPVDLLADYEREYGLPMQCMVPGSQTIEERISVLRWIRQHRNVMNRGYLEQILAIFDVTLVDVVKHRPMLCTAPCTSPVNTERLRYKVLLRLQYPMTANMSCIIENYLPGYLRIEWVVDMPFGDWILNSGYSLVGNNIRYTAYKTNQRDYYDSYADFDLVTALVRSFDDEDMRNLEGFSSAINSLFGLEHTNLTFDGTVFISNQYRYKLLGYQGSNKVTDPTNYFYLYELNYVLFNNSAMQHYGTTSWDYMHYSINNVQGAGVVYILRNGYNSISLIVTREKYDAVVTAVQVAQMIISNTSSSDQAISLLAEAYIEAVANSIFNADESKQFVKLSDLLSQFELNKTLRT